MDIIGENSVFGQILDFETAGNDTAVVMEDGLVNVLDSKGHEQLSNKAPQLSARLKRIIYFRRARRERKILALLNRTVEQRLAKVFINLNEDIGVPRNGGFLLKAELTHRDFAGLIASTRETVTLKLNKLIKDNLIEYEGKYILVRSLREIIGLAN
jgi:CRP-like cAMP-binding protein